MGFIFLSLAVYFIIGRQGLYQAYGKLDKDPDGLGGFVLVLIFVLMFGGFGISSFMRAKRLSRGGTAEGKIGRAAVFAADQVTELGDLADYDFYDKFTLAAWVRPARSTGGIISRYLPCPSGVMGCS